MEYQQADRDYIRLSIAFEGRAKQANELLRNFDSISELFEAIKNVDSDICRLYQSFVGYFEFPDFYQYPAIRSKYIEKKTECHQYHNRL